MKSLEEVQLHWLGLILIETVIGGASHVSLSDMNCFRKSFEND